MKNVKIPFYTKQSSVFIEVAFLVLALNGCNLRQRSGDFPTSYTTIDITDIQDNQLIASDIIKSVKFIPLEFTDECPIASIFKLDFYNDTIFILSGDGLYSFNAEGKFVRRFGNKGNGPGEYVFPFDFSIDRQNRQLIIYDSNKRQIHVYDFSGEFEKSIQVGIAWSVEPVGDDLFLSYPMNIFGDEPYSLKVTDENGDTVTTFSNKLTFKLSGSPFVIPVNGAMYRFGGDIHFKQFLSDTLYLFDSKKLKIKPKYVFRGVNNLPVSLLGNIEQINKEETHYSWVERVLETDKYLFIRLNSYGTVENMIFDKNKVSLYNVQTDIEEDIQTKTINSSAFFWPHYKLSDNVTIRHWSANFFKKYFSEVVSDKESMDILSGYDVDGFLQFYESVKETDNPIIQVITLK